MMGADSPQQGADPMIGAETTGAELQQTGAETQGAGVTQQVVSTTQ